MTNTSDTDRFWPQLSAGRRILVAFIPATLVLVASVQMLRAFTIDQSPWKGGGFGMFATVDSPGNRELRAWLVTDDAEWEVPIHPRSVLTDDELFDAIILARTVPTDENLRRIAEELAGCSWWMTDYQTEHAEICNQIRTLAPQTGDRTVVSLKGLRALRDRETEASAKHSAGDAPSDEAEDALADEPQWAPPHGLGPGKLAELHQQMELAIAEGKLTREEVGEDHHRPQDRIPIVEVRVALWKGRFDGTSTEYRFRLHKTQTAKASGENLNLCTDCLK